MFAKLTGEKTKADIFMTITEKFSVDWFGVGFKKS